MKDDVILRPARPEDSPALAALKEAWAELSHPVTESERNGFTEDLSTWMSSQGQALICRVAEVDRRLVGMAWLVIFERVPDIHDRHRLTGDVQSVFVHPEHRKQGIGAALVQSLVDAADQRSVSRVTVSANAAAVSMYEAAGFTATPFLLERQAGTPRHS
ncbi:GNAT family N-acetyltransferase [Arthrobacter tecti]